MKGNKNELSTMLDIKRFNKEHKGKVELEVGETGDLVLKILKKDNFEEYSIDLTVIDAAGNSSIITHTYQGDALPVLNTVAPVLSSTTQTFTTTVGAPLTLQTVTANDVLGGVVTVVQGGVTPNFNAIGTYAVIYTATDVVGNTSTITHTYQVNAIADTVGPVLSSTTQTFPTTVGAPLTLQTVTANDVLGGVVTVVQGGVIPNFNAIGIYTVIYTATDAAGNTSTITHTYLVNAIPDTTPPVSPTTMSFSGVTPDTKNTQYNDLSICLNDSIVGGGNISLNSSNGGIISNLNIDGEGRVIFDFLTPNINGTILTLTGLNSIGNRFNITLNLTLPLRSNL